MDVNSNKLGGTVAERNKRLVKLMNGVGDMKLGSYQDNTIDAFGDAYEYLMGMYASNAGKSGGEYFTPQEVSELLTRIAVYGKTEINKVYEIKTIRLIQGFGSSHQQNMRETAWFKAFRNDEFWDVFFYALFRRRRTVGGHTRGLVGHTR